QAVGRGELAAGARGIIDIAVDAADVERGRWHPDRPPADQVVARAPADRQRGCVPRVVREIELGRVDRGRASAERAVATLDLGRRVVAGEALLGPLLDL